MYPQVIGFDAKNLEITAMLPVVMGNLLQSIILKDPLSYLVKCELSIYVQKHKNDYIELDNITSDMNNFSKLKQYVRGLIFLKHHNVLNQLDNVKYMFISLFYINVLYD